MEKLLRAPVKRLGTSPQLFDCPSCLLHSCPARIWHQNTPFIPVWPLPSSPSSLLADRDS